LGGGEGKTGNSLQPRRRGCSPPGKERPLLGVRRNFRSHEVKHSDNVRGNYTQTKKTKKKKKERKRKKKRKKKALPVDERHRAGSVGKVKKKGAMKA